MGDTCTQVGEPAVEKTGRPEGLPRTAVIKRLCRRASGCKKAPSLRILYRQVAKPESPCEKRGQIYLIPTSAKPK